MRPIASFALTLIVALAQPAWAAGPIVAQINDPVIDLGSVMAGTQRSFSFFVTNSSAQPVTISAISTQQQNGTMTTGTFTPPAPPPAPILAGARAQLTVTYTATSAANFPAGATGSAITPNAVALWISDNTGFYPLWNAAHAVTVQAITSFTGEQDQGAFYYDPGFVSMKVAATQGGATYSVDQGVLKKGNAALTAADFPINLTASFWDGAKWTNAAISVTSETQHQNRYNQTITNAKEYVVTRAAANLCASGAGVAVPMAGYWKDGSITEAATTISLACVPSLTASNGSASVAAGGGSVAKCIDWGFAPWSDPAGHRACVAMAMADYCGTGESRTIFPGPTLIDIYPKSDLLLLAPDVNSPVVSPSHQHAADMSGTAPMDFEAVWQGSGAGLPAVCFAKWRFVNLVPSCALSVPACSAAQLTPTWLTAHSLFVNYSKTQAVPLLRCVEEEGRAVTTTEVAFSPMHLAPTLALDGADRYSCASKEAFQGLVFAGDSLPDLRRGIPGLRDGDLAALYLQRVGAGFVTTTAPDPAAHPRLQGYLIAPAARDRPYLKPYVGQLLEEYRCKGGQTAATTAPAQCRRDKPLGYLVRWVREPRKR